MCVAGEYLFTVEGTTGVVKILDARTGVVLGEMKPGAEVGGRIGWVDIPYGITAHQRKDGEYLVLVEDNYKSKNLMFRFRTPEAGAPQVVQQVQSSAGEGRVRLSWSGSNDAVAWQVFRSDVSTGPYHAIGTVDGRNNFTDLSADPGVAFFYRVQAVGWGGRSEMSEAVTATASSRRSLLLEDFESVDSAIAGFVVVPMPAPQLDGGGTQVGRASSINWLPEIALPEGASTLVIEYHRLFLKNPEDGCKSHFTRQYVNFNNNGGTRVGQEERYPLTGGDAGKWTHVRWTVPIPPGVTAVTSGELNSLIEDARPDYDNPVYIDEFKVSVE